jgi:hypothetical protein
LTVFACFARKFDDLVRSGKSPFSVIPAKAGIQSFQAFKEEPDSDFHRSGSFLRDHQNPEFGIETACEAGKEEPALQSRFTGNTEDTHASF